MSEQISIKNIEPVRVAYRSYQGDVRSAGKLMPSIFKAIRGRNTGAPFFCIYKTDPKTKIGEVELCVPTAEQPAAADVGIKTFPQMRALSLIHKGSYDTLAAAYKQLSVYIQKNDLTVTGACREVYIKGPGALFKGNPAGYITEILMPVVWEEQEDD
ncbi:GyrI-like domain-containing protein [Enterococcus sp. LJL128]|uniref:GyrI-like domain-containing protein n=1 Tax=Enterococcus sp. LJL51 TaxID=3416656 RepID=UPI003CF51175